MENNNLTMLDNENLIPFTAGYRLVGMENLPQWFLKFRRLGFESYIQNFDFVRLDKKLFDFISSSDFSNSNIEVFPSFDMLLKYPMFDIEAYTVVLVNGKYSAELSSEEELPFSVFSDGIINSVYEDEKFLDGKLRCDDNVFVSLNSAFLSNGIVIQINDGEKLEKPIHIVSIITSMNEKICSFPRVFFKVGNNVKVDVIESLLSFDEENYFENRVVELFVGKNSDVNYYKFLSVSKNSCIVENSFVNVLEGAHFNQVSFGKNLGIIRLKNIFEIDVGADVKFVSSFDANRDNDVSVEVDLKHIGERAESDVSLFAVASDKANVSFKTSVECKRQIDKVKTSQNSRILLASNDAVGRIKTFQNIESEGVKAFHGAGVSGISVKDLFFLESRGLGEQDAKNLIFRSCLANILQNIHNNKIFDEYSKFLCL